MLYKETPCKNFTSNDSQENQANWSGTVEDEEDGNFYIFLGNNQNSSTKGLTGEGRDLKIVKYQKGFLTVSIVILVSSIAWVGFPFDSTSEMDKNPPGAFILLD